MFVHPEQRKFAEKFTSALPPRYYRMTGRERKALMTQKRGRQRQLARRLQLSEGYLSKVVAGVEPGTRRIHVAVARAFRKPVHEVFPPQDAGNDAASAVQ